MDDMSGWPLLRQAKEWEGKLVLLTDMNADAVHLAELPAGGSPGAEYPTIPPGGPAVSTVQHALLADLHQHYRHYQRRAQLYVAIEAV